MPSKKSPTKPAVRHSDKASIKGIDPNIRQRFTGIDPTIRETFEGPLRYSLSVRTNSTAINEVKADGESRTIATVIDSVRADHICQLLNADALPSEFNRAQSSARCRDLVRTAAYSVKNRIARAWLYEDSKGTWEGEAARLLNVSANRAAEPKLTDAQVDEAIVVELAILALTAVREHLAKKRAK